MKIINHANSFVEKTLGVQKAQAGSMVRVASWCIFVKEENAGVLVFNNLTKELMLLDEEEMRLLAPDDFEYSRLFEYSGRFSLLMPLPDDGTENIVRDLFTSWFLVPAKFDEKEVILQLRELVSVMDVKEGFSSYTILTTTDCNARCFYCYEFGYERIGMDHRTAMDVVGFIESTAGKKINLSWFGGEPLYNMEAIRTITEKLRSDGYSFTSSMISNGYLFDEDIVQCAVEKWNLKKVQITLDGTEHVYNKRKAFIYRDSNAFVKVTDNIERLLAAGINISIRLNMDSDNIEELYRLCDYLAARYGSCKNFSAYVNYIFQSQAPDPLVGEISDMYKELRKLRNYMNEIGIQKRTGVRNEIRTHQCMADTDSSIVISPTGDLYKCEHLGERSCGTIYTGIQDREGIDDWKKPAADGEICDHCPLYSDCVRITACPTNFEFCHPAALEVNMEQMKEMILYTYKTYMETT